MRRRSYEFVWLEKDEKQGKHYMRMGLSYPATTLLLCTWRSLHLIAQPYRTNELNWVSTIDPMQPYHTGKTRGSTISHALFGMARIHRWH